MKKFVFLLFIAAVAATTSSCSQKSGCPSTASLAPKTNKKGQFMSSGHKSDLFPKSMRKKMGH
jgi:hypothetical protein